jgi:hypothetical protein
MSDYLGYLASTLVLWTFCTRTMLPLRVSAIASNVAFIAYGALLHLYPVLVLHVVLLPLNTWRLTEIFRLSRPARDAAAADEAFRGLLPLAKRISARRGETVIHEGEVADALYLVIEGVLWVDDIEASGDWSALPQFSQGRGSLATQTARVSISPMASAPSDLSSRMTLMSSAMSSRAVPIAAFLWHVNRTLSRPASS